MIYFWKPQWYWYGWRTLIPFFMGEDPDGKRTAVFGWTVTGRMIARLWKCTDPECARWHDPEYARSLDSA